MIATTPSPLRLTRCTPTQRRALLAHLAGHPASPLTAAQKVAMLRALADYRWEPSVDDMPVPWALVEAWCNDILTRRHA